LKWIVYQALGQKQRQVLLVLISNILGCFWGYVSFLHMKPLTLDFALNLTLDFALTLQESAIPSML
jgi:hypothetical protein